MTRDEAIEELKCAIELIKQNGEDWVDERDIPVFQMAIEALEHKRGKWIDLIIKDDIIVEKCSACGYLKYVYDRQNYCPNCGARMVS